VRVFRQKFTLEDAIESHACSLEALACVRPMSFLSEVHSLLPVDSVMCVATLKAQATMYDGPRPDTQLAGTCGGASGAPIALHPCTVALL
jgi:hypothetical protein